MKYLLQKEKILEELCAAGDHSLELETGQNVELEPCLVKLRIGLEQDQIMGVKQCQDAKDEPSQNVDWPPDDNAQFSAVFMRPGKHI